MRLVLPCALILALAAAPAQAVVQTCNTAIPATTPTSAFRFNTSGTVTDSRTGLEWRRCLEGETFSASGDPLTDTCTGDATEYTWQGALDDAALASGDGWRLPNVSELETIIEDSCTRPAANLQLFPSVVIDDLWSASASAVYANSAWYVDFYSGGAAPFYRNLNFHVRLVRGGQ